MTTEEKAKAYDEAMNKIKPLYEQAKRDGNPIWSTYEHLIPELHESENERIREEIIEFLQSFGETDEWIAWLEKQKEQDHICDSTQFEEGFKTGFEIGLRKQKEQKPDVELIQRSWYMEGYHDREFGNEPKWILKTGEGGPKHELNPRYGQPLVEEQKPTEEQLHNLNEAIKGLRMDGCERMADSLHSLYNILRRNKEQKPAEWSEEDNIGWEEALACVTRVEKSAKNEEEIQNAVTAEKWLKEIKFKYYVHPVKQEWSEEDEDRIRQIERIAQQAGCTQKLQEEIHDWFKSIRRQAKLEWSEEDEMYLSQAIETLEHENYLILADKLKSLRPQQHSWSKEDRNMLDIIISELEQEGKNANVPGLYHLEIDFLKSLPERFNLQSKQEWSEADETYLQYALWCVEKAEKSCKDGEDKGACWSARRWLKSLRPQPKQEWSEEDEK